MKGASVLADKWSDELVVSCKLRNQIKTLLSIGGGVFSSVKALKSIYAILQSVSPTIFDLNWDALFFSIYSRAIQNELLSLVMRTCEIKEVLWGNDVDPFHHMYFLTDQAQKSLEESTANYQAEPFYVDFLLWSLLPPQFALYWSYLLEMYSYEGLDEKTREKLPYLPLFKDERALLKDKRDSEKEKRLQDKLTTLCEDLKKLRIEPLKVGSMSPCEDNNLYIFLPLEFGKEQMDRFIEFYASSRHNKFVQVRPNGPNGKFSVKVDSQGITSIYRYIVLSDWQITKALERFSFYKKDLEGLVTFFTKQQYRRITMSEGCEYDYYFVYQQLQNRTKYLQALPNKVKDAVINKGELMLTILNEYYEIAQWRYEHIIRTLVELAKLTNDTSIDLICKSVDLEGYRNNRKVDQQTLVAFEFPDEFREKYKEIFGHGLPSGNLHHVYHFVQPVEALKAIHNNKEQSLLWGGPVVGEY